MTDFGYDLECLSDTGLSDVIVTAPYLVVGQRIARMLQTPKGGLAAIGDDAAWGLDVRQYLLGRLSPAARNSMAQEIRDAVMRDDAISSCTVTADFVSGGALTVTIAMTGDVGPFVMVMNVSALTVEAVFAR